MGPLPERILDFLVQQFCTDVAIHRANHWLNLRVEAVDFVLTPEKKKPRLKAKIIKDPATGFPVLDAGPDARSLTSEEVADILADFP